MINKKISIIIPVYNSEKTIERAINSAISQDYINKEIIVVNDGSFDHTMDIVRKFKESIKIINTEHLGVSHARNVGIGNSTGDYILFLDSDDYLLPDCLNIMIDNIMDYDVLCCSYKIKNKAMSYNYFFDKLEMNQEQFIKGLCKINSNDDYMYTWGKMFKRNTLSENLFPEGIRIGEDIAALIKVALKSTKIKTIDKEVYVYDKTKSAATKNIFTTDYLDLYIVWDMIKKEFEKANTGYIDYAEINLWRLDYTILARLMLSKRKVRKENVDLIINTNKRLKNNYKKLLCSRIVTSRKIAVVIVLFISDLYIRLGISSFC